MDYGCEDELPAYCLSRLAPRGSHDANAVRHVHGIIYTFIHHAGRTRASGKKQQNVTGTMREKSTSSH